MTPPSSTAPRVLPALLLLLLLMLLGPTAAANAEAPRIAGPHGRVTTVIATSGLSWEDVTDATPNLQCLAQRSGVAALSISSMTPTHPTKRQGMESLHSGYLGLASQSHRTSRAPRPVTDLLRGVEVADVGSLPARGVSEGPEDPGSARGKRLARLDDRVGALLDERGGCASDSLDRVILVSVAPYDPADPAAVESGRRPAPGPARLQVVMDSGFPSSTLTSGSTHQNGVVLLTDVAPTILASLGEQPPAGLPGQPFSARPDADPVGLALDRSMANRLVDGASGWALGVVSLVPLLGLLLLLIPPLARHPRAAAVARAASTCLPLGIAAGFLADVMPWWRTGHPALALTAVVASIGLALSAIALLGPWRRVRWGSPGVAGALTALVLLLESATGSRLQLGSPLGAQAIRGGRFYGLSNHMSGIVLAGTLIALLAWCLAVRGPRLRILGVIGIGMVVMGVSAAPQMGADFGSVLALLPAIAVLVLMLSGIRVRLWHAATVAVVTVAVVGGVSVLDWLRPPAQRTHLGRFVDQVLSGQLLDVVGSKLQQNLDQVLQYWPLLLVLAAAAVVWVASLVPGRTGLRRLAAFDAAHPPARPVRVALGIGAWIGFATNDTGAMMLTAAFVVSLALFVPMLPDPAPSPRRV